MKKIIFLLAALFVFALPALSLADTDVTIGVIGAFYEDLWQPAAEVLKGEGINITLQQFSDFSIPNNALNSEEIQISRYGYDSDLLFCEHLAEKAGVGAVPGSSFFREPVRHLIRLHFAKQESTLCEALNRLADMDRLF